MSLVRTFTLAAGLLLALGSMARADAAPPRICILPVKDGAPTVADAGDTWRIYNTIFRIPGLPALVFTPNNRGGAWTISADRRLIPYDGPFPRSYLDSGDWAMEPWSSRIVAVTYGGGVSVLQPGTGHFEAIDTASAGPDARYNSVTVLPRRKQSVAVSARGVPFVVADRSLTPWMSLDELSSHGVHGIYSLHDAPTLSATIVVDLDRRIYVLADDGAWHKVASLDEDDYGRIADGSTSGTALFFANKSVIAIRRDGASSASFSAQTLATARRWGAGRLFATSRLFKRTLAYDGAGFFDRHPRWRQLGPDGMEDIPGGDIGIESSELGPQIQDLPTLNRTLVRGRDGLYFYDGTAFVSIPRSSPSTIGRFPRIHDLSSLGRVIVVSEYGFFELTRDGLIAKAMPFPMIGPPVVDIADWPEAGIALVSTRDGLYALDRDLNAAPVPGGKRIELESNGFAVGTNPATGEMLLGGTKGLFLAVNAPDTSCTP